MGKAQEAVKRIAGGGLSALQELRYLGVIVQEGAKYAGHGLLLEISQMQAQGLLDGKGNVTAKAKGLYR